MRYIEKRSGKEKVLSCTCLAGSERIEKDGNFLVCSSCGEILMRTIDIKILDEARESLMYDKEASRIRRDDRVKKGREIKTQPEIPAIKPVFNTGFSEISSTLPNDTYEIYNISSLKQNRDMVLKKKFLILTPWILVFLLISTVVLFQSLLS